MSEVQTVKNTDTAGPVASMLPAVDVIEDANGITLYADLPGIAKDKLGLHIEHDTLIIEGTIDVPVSQGIEAHHVEVDVLHYRRVFSLSKELDTERVTAQFANGVLKLNIPKAEHAQPKKINVTIN